MDDVLGETKPIFVENFGDVKPPKVEAKPNIDGASVHFEASLHVDSGVVPLDANEVDTTHFFSEEVQWKYRDDLLNWVRHVRYSSFKKAIEVMITSTDTIDDLKAQLNTYFEYLGEN